MFVIQHTAAVCAVDWMVLLLLGKLEIFLFHVLMLLLSEPLVTMYLQSFIGTSGMLLKLNCLEALIVNVSTRRCISPSLYISQSLYQCADYPLLVGSREGYLVYKPVPLISKCFILEYTKEENQKELSNPGSPVEQSLKQKLW